MVPAVILTLFSYENLGGVFSLLPYATLFYNGTEAEFNNTFVEFLAIPASTTSLGPLSYNDITKVLPPDSETSEGVIFIHFTLFSHIDNVSSASCAYKLAGFATRKFFTLVSFIVRRIVAVP